MMMHGAFDPVEKQNFNFVEKIDRILTIETLAKTATPKLADWLRNTLAEELMRLATPNRPGETAARAQGRRERAMPRWCRRSCRSLFTRRHSPKQGLTVDRQRRSPERHRPDRTEVRCKDSKSA